MPKFEELVGDLTKGRIDRREFLALAPAAALVASGAALASDGNPLHMAPRRADDINPNPDVVEVVLVAHQRPARIGSGEPLVMYGYNGGTPGPTIEAKVGDTLIVHFFNKLPEETTVHWHGVEIPALMDGSHISQIIVPSGGSFRYEFKLLRAAAYWYHPHVRTNEQIEKGLYGALIVRDPQEETALGLPQDEHVLFLDDILVDENGQLAPHVPVDPVENAVQHLNGREGNTLLTNGGVEAFGAVRRSVPQRFRLYNVANSRFMRMSIPGHTIYRIGGDAGLIEEPVEIQPITQVPDPDDPARTISDPDTTKGILLTPGERADIVVTPQGDLPLRLEWHDHKRGRHTVEPAIVRNGGGPFNIGHDMNDGKAPPQVMAKFGIVGPQLGGDYVPPAFLRQADPIDTTGAGAFTYDFGHAPPDEFGEVIFFVQGFENLGQCVTVAPTPCPLPFEDVTPEDALTVNVGDSVILTVNNLTGGDHNFHMHGFFFQHIDTEFKDLDTPENNFVVPAERVEWKDTLFLPKRPGMIPTRSRTVTRVAVKFDDTGREGMIAASGKVPTGATSGGWLMHCHILEHSRAGMMTFIEVLD